MQYDRVSCRRLHKQAYYAPNNQPPINVVATYRATDHIWYAKLQQPIRRKCLINRKYRRQGCAPNTAAKLQPASRREIKHFINDTFRASLKVRSNRTTLTGQLLAITANSNGQCLWAKGITCRYASLLVAAAGQINRNKSRFGGRLVTLFG